MMTTGRNPSPSRSRSRGFSAVEVLCGMSVMFVGLLSLAGSTATGMATMQTNQESAQALRAARCFIEGMQVGDVPFETLFVAYARDTRTAEVAEETQSTGGAGGLLGGLVKKATGTLSRTTEPLLSREFAVPELTPALDAVNASIGELRFPTADGPEGPELREDVAGRDLNADGVIDTEDHSHDYVILPVTVRIEWKGARGARHVELNSLLVRK